MTCAGRQIRRSDTAVGVIRSAAQLYSNSLTLSARPLPATHWQFSPMLGRMAQSGAGAMRKR